VRQIAGSIGPFSSFIDFRQRQAQALAACLHLRPCKRKTGIAQWRCGQVESGQRLDFGETINQYDIHA
jgi:hypothetical protein